MLKAGKLEMNQEPLDRPGCPLEAKFRPGWVMVSAFALQLWSGPAGTQGQTTSRGLTEALALTTGEPSQGSFYPKETTANHTELPYLRNAPSTGGFLALRQDCERHILSKGHCTARKSHHKNDCLLCLLLKTAPILVFTVHTHVIVI